MCPVSKIQTKFKITPPYCTAYRKYEISMAGKRGLKLQGTLNVKNCTLFSFWGNGGRVREGCSAVSMEDTQGLQVPRISALSLTPGWCKNIIFRLEPDSWLM